MSDTFQEDLLKKLGEPFPQAALKTREGGGGKRLTYVETHTVIHRLNAAAKTWDWAITSTEWRNDLLIVTGVLTIPGLGSRAGTGVQKVVERAGEDLVKGAASDALKKAATLFSVGLELYGPDYESDDAPRAAVPVGQPTLAQQVRREAPTKNDGDSPDEPCEVPGCELVCAGKFVGFSRRTYDLVLCAKHSKRAKDGALDLDAVKYEIASGIHVDHNRHDGAQTNKNGPQSDERLNDGPMDFNGSWTAFWNHWRPLGLHNSQDIVRKTGLTDIDLSGMTPEATHALLMESAR